MLSSQAGPVGPPRWGAWPLELDSMKDLTLFHALLSDYIACTCFSPEGNDLLLGNSA